MEHENFFLDFSGDSRVRNYQFPPNSIRFYPVDINSTRQPQADDDNEDGNVIPSSFSFMYGSTNLNEKVTVASFVPLSSTRQPIPRRNYTFLGGCSLKHDHSLERPFSLETPPCTGHASKLAASDSYSGEKSSYLSCSKNDQPNVHDDEDCYDDTDFNSADLTVALQISSGEVGFAAAQETSTMYCHFDNSPEDNVEPSVMIALKFNDIRAVVQAHGHLDGCSQFVKVDLGIGDRTRRGGGNASSEPAAAEGSREEKEKRFSCVLTSTFPCKPTHPSQCVVTGRLCSITEWESALLDYYSTSFSPAYTSTTCQEGIGEGKSDKTSGGGGGKLKFLQGHIFLSICAADYYDLNGGRGTVVRTGRLPSSLQTTNGGVTDFERRLLETQWKEGKRKQEAEREVKSPTLAEMIEIHGKPSASNYSSRGNTREFLMNTVSTPAITALITYLKGYPLREFGITVISCATAITLIEIGRKYKVTGLEEYICHLIVGEKEHLWFDIKSLIHLHQLYANDSNSLSQDGNKVKKKVMQAFQMKRREDDTNGYVDRCFRENPEFASGLLMDALTICSKCRPSF